MSKQKDEGIDLNSNIVAGILSVFVIFVEIVGLIYMISKGQFFGLADMVILIAFSYTAHKTLIKNKKLTKWEWAAFIVLFLYSLLAILMGFILGFTGAIQL